MNTEEKQIRINSESSDAYRNPSCEWVENYFQMIMFALWDEF